MTTSFLRLGQPLGLFDDHLGDLNVARGRFVEGRRDHFAAHRALHFGHFLRPLVDQQHDQHHVRVIGRDRVRDVLHQHGLAALGARDQQAALALADRRNDVDQSPGDVLLAAHVALEDQRLVGEQRRQVLEQDAVLGRLRRDAVDLVDLDQREVALAVLRRAHLAFDRVAGVQVEAPDLRRRDVDVVGAGEVRRLGRAQEAEAVRQDFQRAVAEDLLAALGALLQDRKHQLLLAQPVGVVDLEADGHFEQLGNVQGFEFGKVHGDNRRSCGTPCDCSGRPRGGRAGERRPG